MVDEYGNNGVAQNYSNGNDEENFNEFDDYFRDLDDGMGIEGSEDEDNFLDIYNLSPRQRVVHQFKKNANHLLSHYNMLPIWQRVAFVIAGGVISLLAFILLIFHNRILHKVVKASNDLKTKWSTSVVLVILVFLVAFPPLIGFSLVSTVTGLIYGVSMHGWIILAIGAVSGSIASFTLFKTILHSKAERLIHMDRKFEALASILQENNNFWIIALLRLCPFPYSLTNGAIAAVYQISIKNFAIANVITTPKLVIYLFVGSRIKSIGETDSSSSKLFDILSILLTLVVVTITAWVLYFKTKERYLQLQNQSQSPGNIANDPSFEI